MPDEATASAHGGLSRGEWVLGRYRIEHMLGQGGVASVYRALDHKTGRELALKQLYDAGGSASGRALALFQREYRTLAQIAHPGIIRVFDYGLGESGPFYTMELLDGRDLCDLAPMPWRDACRALCEVASALAILHSRRLLHRDLSHRNVRLTQAGRAKLFDFGAMAPMGFAREVIGTPPFVSPEAAEAEPLDQRSDLYALGALGYFLLASRHAYPAQSLRELRELLRQGQPALPLAADVPPALGRLVLGLMQRDPRLRPSSAAEVIDRLSAIADLPRALELGVARSYLVNPKLIGRQAALGRLSAALERGLAGAGAVLAIEGGPGTGKSRLLDELALEAVLAGATVLRAACSANARDSHAVMRVLLDALREKTPQAFEATPERAELLAPIHPAFRRAPGEAAGEAWLGTEKRARQRSELCDFLREQGARAPLVLAIDDFAACDDDSRAVFAELACDLGSSRCVLVATIDDAQRAEHRGELLRARATERVQLRAFDRAETEALVESLFGSVPNASRLAGFLHEHARGNPLECVELARDLLERGDARYVDGAWILPPELPVGPARRLSETYRARVARLDEDARELAEVLAVYGRPAPLALCLELCARRPAAASFEPVDRLLAAELAIARGDALALSRDGIREAVLSELSPERASHLHLRIGRTLSARGAADAPAMLAAGRHLICGGELGAGLALLDRALADREALLALGPSIVPALELGLEAAEAKPELRALSARLRALLLRCAFLYDRTLLHYADSLIEETLHASGVDRAAELGAGASGVPRVYRALALAQQHFAAAPAGENRGLAPLEALAMLGSAIAMTLGVAIMTYDLARIARLRAIVEVFDDIAKDQTLAVVYDLVATVHAAFTGYNQAAERLREAMLARLNDPAKYVGMPEDDRKSAALTQLHAFGVIEAGCDADKALAIADAIDAFGLKTFASAALQVRWLCELYRGDLRAARAHELRIEELSLQSPGGRQAEIWVLGYLIRPYDLWGDIIALKRIVERLGALVDDHPGYRPVLLAALAAYYRARGQHRRAKSALERALALAPRGEHAWWFPLMGAYIESLVACGEHARALALAEQELIPAGDELGGTRCRDYAAAALAIARAKLGDFATAAAQLEQAIAAAAHRPLVRRTALYEARARVAILARERDVFERYAGTVLREYRALNNPALMARHFALLEEAAQAGLVPSPAPARGPAGRANDAATATSAPGSTELDIHAPLETLLVQPE